MSAEKLMYASCGGIALYAVQFLTNTPDTRAMYGVKNCTDKQWAESSASWFGIALAQNAYMTSVYFNTDDDTKKAILSITSVNFGMAFLHYMYQVYSTKNQKLDYGAIIFQLGMMAGAGYYASK